MSAFKANQYSRACPMWRSVIAGLAILASSAVEAHGISKHLNPTISSRDDGTPPGWTLFDEGTLGPLGLEKDCEAAIYQRVQCDEIARWLAIEKIGVADESAVELACTAGCDNSLQDLLAAVAISCGPKTELVTGMPILDIVGRLEDNWMQSCLADPTTGENCNSVIADLPDVDELDELTDSYVCSYCFTHNLQVMQASKYTSDDDHEFYKSQYQYVTKRCFVNVTDFEASPSAFIPTNDDAPKQPDCASGKTYLVQQGDTCDSIARFNMVSAATLFHTNPNILNCEAAQVGATLCLPPGCETIVSVRPDDTCASIAASSGVTSEALISFNSQLNRDCSNLQGANPSWGSVLCTSTPGGNKSAQVPAPDVPASKVPSSDVPSSANGDRDRGLGRSAAMVMVVIAVFLGI